MKKLLSLLLASALLVTCFTTSIFAQPPFDSETVTISVPVRIQANYKGSETAGDTQFTFTVTDLNGNNPGNGFVMTADYITLANGHNSKTGIITFYFNADESTKAMLEEGILFRQVVGNKSGWTYDTATYTLKFHFDEDSVEADAAKIDTVSVNNGAYQNYTGTGWQLNFTNYYTSGNVVTNPPHHDFPPKYPDRVHCAGKYDYNCDGTVTCGERYGDGWVWSNAKDGCVYRGSGSPNIAVDEPTNDVEVTVGDTTVSASQSGWGNNNNIIVIPNTATK